MDKLEKDKSVTKRPGQMLQRALKLTETRMISKHKGANFQSCPFASELDGMGSQILSGDNEQAFENDTQQSLFNQDMAGHNTQGSQMNIDSQMEKDQKKKDKMMAQRTFMRDSDILIRSVVEDKWDADERAEEMEAARLKEVRRRKREAAAKLKKQNMFKSIPENKPGFVKSIQKRILHAQTMQTSLQGNDDIYSLKREYDKNLLSAQFKKQQFPPNQAKKHFSNPTVLNQLAENSNLCALLINLPTQPASMMTDSIGTGGKWGQGTQVTASNRPTVINGKVFKFKEKRPSRRESILSRKQNINRKMNTDDILMYSIGPKGMASKGQPNFKDLENLDFDTDLRNLFTEAPLNSTGLQTSFGSKRASSVNRTAVGSIQHESTDFRNKTSLQIREAEAFNLTNNQFQPPRAAMTSQGHRAHKRASTGNYDQVGSQGAWADGSFFGKSRRPTHHLQEPQMKTDSFAHSMHGKHQKTEQNEKTSQHTVYSSNAGESCQPPRQISMSVFMRSTQRDSSGNAGSFYMSKQAKREKSEQQWQRNTKQNDIIQSKPQQSPPKRMKNNEVLFRQTQQSNDFKQLKEKMRSTFRTHAVVLTDNRTKSRGSTVQTGVGNTVTGQITHGMRSSDSDQYQAVQNNYGDQPTTPAFSKDKQITIRSHSIGPNRSEQKPQPQALKTNQLFQFRVDPKTATEATVPGKIGMQFNKNIF